MAVAMKFRTIFWLSLCLILTSCGGGGGSTDDNGGPTTEAPGDTDGADGTDDTDDTGGSGDNEETPAEGAPTVTVNSSIKQLLFSWNSQDGDDYYVLSENPDGASGFTDLVTIEDGTEAALDIAVHHHDWADAAYIVDACNAADECVPSLNIATDGAMPGAIGYFKASNADAGDEFGQSVALSDDGRTLAVGAHYEQSSASGINGNENDNSIEEGTGAVYIFTLGESGWIQEAYIKATEIVSGDDFGHSVALSADGNTLAVGATWKNHTEDSGPRGVGAVYVLTREGGEWTQQAALHGSNDHTGSRFGLSVDLSDDGNLLAVGAPGEINHPENQGEVYVFARTDSAWAETAHLKVSNGEAGDQFGHDIALSGDGSTLAIGAFQESSSATGVGGDETDNAAAQAGAVYMFSRESSWTQQAYLKASDTAADDRFGITLAISGNGDLLAVGAHNVDEDENIGAVYMFSRADSSWTQADLLIASNEQAKDAFGNSLALSSDGSVLAIGAGGEDSAAAGIGGDQNSNSVYNSGAAYMFARSGSDWTQTAYVKAANPQINSYFGHSVALDGSGDTLAVGAIWEDGASTGIGGDQANQLTEKANVGAVYLY